MDSNPLDQYQDRPPPAGSYRRLRLLGLEKVSPEERAAPSCVLVQIDGLSYRNFRKALQTGKLPFLSRLLRRGQAVAGPWQSMLPTSTSAFQAGLFYGNNDEIPAFFWYDKEAGREIRMNGAEDTARVEDDLERRVAPFRGLLAGGSSYSALFDGGADNSFLTFARMFSPRYNLTARRGWIYLFLLSQVKLFARVIYYTTIELLLAIYDFARGLFSHKDLYIELKFLVPRIFSVVVCREIATLAAILDIYRGVGPIYLNHFAYDEHAHHRGPDSHFAFWALRGIDASVRRVWQAAERARARGIRQYDVFVWSDHGQTPAVPFQEMFGDLPERHFDMFFRALHGPVEEESRLRRESREEEVELRRRRRRPRPDSHRPPLAPEYLDRQAQRARSLSAGESGKRLFLTSTGPVAFINLPEFEGRMTWEDWCERYPRFLNLLAQHRGVGFALTRTRAYGCMAGHGGRWFDLFDDAALTANLPDYQARILRGRREEFRRWVNMRNAGDLMLFGLRGPKQETIAYSWEHGSHGGPSTQETTPFILVPRAIAPSWPEVTIEHTDNPLTLADLHRRLRRAYNPQQVVEIDPRITADPVSATEPLEKPA